MEQKQYLESWWKYENVSLELTWNIDRDTCIEINLIWKKIITWQYFLYFVMQQKFPRLIPIEMLFKMFNIWYAIIHSPNIFYCKELSEKNINKSYRY